MTQTLRRPLAAGVAAVVVLLVATGCVALSRSGGRAVEPRTEERVAADPRATASEIIDTGGPTGVAVHEGGVTLVSWSATTDTTEGPEQGAWRLYDSDGNRVADGTLGQVFDAAATPGLAAVPDGFLLTDYVEPGFRHLGLDGTLTDVRRARARTPTRAGDVLVRDFYTSENTAFYRPSQHRVYRLPRLPFEDVEQVALDRTGRLWVQPLWGDRTASVYSSADGTAPWTRTRVPIAPGGQPQTLAVAAGKVLMNTAGATGSLPALDALWTRPVSGSPAARWRRVDVTGVRVRETEPVLGALPDGRLTIAGGNQRMYLQGEDGAFARLRPPDGMRYSELMTTANGLYLVGSPNDELYRSVDGSEWRTVDR
jgi:hypothetical protein